MVCDPVSCAVVTVCFIRNLKSESLSAFQYINPIKNKGTEKARNDWIKASKSNGEFHKQFS